MTSKGEFAAGRGLYYSLFSRFFVFSQGADRFSGVNAMLGLASAHALNEESAAAIMRIQAKFEFSTLCQVRLETRCPTTTRATRSDTPAQKCVKF